jgi:hypothetical protein
MKGWGVGGKSGLETVLLLARCTPLPPDTQLAKLISLPATNLTNHHRVVEFRSDRKAQPFEMSCPLELRGPKEALEIPDPLLKLAVALKPHFDYVQAISFAYEGE